MKFFGFGIRRKSSNRNVPAENAVDTYIQPFKEMPSSRAGGEDSVDRINAHDLFSLYTADIIKEETMFAR